MQRNCMPLKKLNNRLIQTNKLHIENNKYNIVEKND